MIDHSYEEIRNVALDLLAGREKPVNTFHDYQSFSNAVAHVFCKRENDKGINGENLSKLDGEKFLEIFWGFFREGVITLGINDYSDHNRNFPFFRVSEFGKRLLGGGEVYFFHDVSSYENIINKEIPIIDEVTFIYIKEAMRAFRANCILSSTVMLGVATEHTFLLLMEKIDQNPAYSPIYANVGQQKTILSKVNKFKNILDQQVNSLPPKIKEDIDTNFAGILSIIRNFRNQSGHPTGKIVEREQAYILLNLFIPYCKKMYELMDFFKK